MSDNYKLLPDLPVIPKELYSDIYWTIANDKPVAEHVHHFQTFKCPDSVTKYLRESNEFFADPKLYFTVQCINNLFPVHVDHGRDEAYNFLIDTGGSTAMNVFYKGTGWEADFPEFDIIEAVRIPQGVWHRLNTTVYHNVINFWKPRISISVAKYDFSKERVKGKTG